MQSMISNYLSYINVSYQRILYKFSYSFIEIYVEDEMLR